MESTVAPLFAQKAVHKIAMQTGRHSVDGIVYRDGEASAEVSHWSQISHVGFTDDAGHELTGRPCIRTRAHHLCRLAKCHAELESWKV